MKKSILSILSLLFVTTLLAQAPQGFNYQAVVRDNNGDAIANANVSLRFSLHQTTAGGTVVYQEMHSPTTSDLGLTNVVIGEGTPLSGTFNTIDWGSDAFFMEVELDPVGGSSYSSLGTQQLMSVPYALHATSSDPSDKLVDDDNDTKIQVDEGGVDEDIIRFDMAGTEFFRMDSGRIEVVNTGNSVFIGEDAGANDDFSNNNNVAVGQSVLNDNTTGSNNTAIGYRALETNTIGNRNTAIGGLALSNTDEDETDNTAVGYEALRDNRGSFNTATGVNALHDNWSVRNTANGYNSLEENTTGNDNTASGYGSLEKNDGGQFNTASGSYSLSKNADGRHNTATGYKSLWESNDGHQNTGIGSFALYNNYEGSSNTAIGYKALWNDEGNFNTAVGYQADVVYWELTNATAIGANAKVDQDSSLVLGNAAKVGIGTSVPSDKLHVVGSIRMEDGNEALGKVLTSDTSGVASWQLITAGTVLVDADSDTKIQVDEGGVDEDIIRFDIGGTEYFRMDSGRLEVVNTGGSIFLGEGTGTKDDYTTNRNVGIGNNVLSSNTSGSFNVAIGEHALNKNTTSQLVAIGYEAMENNTTGVHNVAVGWRALHGNATGDENSAFGTRADILSGTPLTNATAIGAFSFATQSNSLILGQIDGVNGAFYDTNVGIGTTAPNARLHVVGDVIISDGNQAAGYVLASDANGLASWQDPNLLVDSGDDLGNHTATQNVDLDGNWLSGDGGNEGVYIGTNGNVGVGTSTPSEALEVVGNVSLNTDDPEVVFLDETGSNGDRRSAIRTQLYSNIQDDTVEDQEMSFHVSNNTNTGMVRVMTLVGNGNMGVGTSSPSSPLEVEKALDAGALVTLSNTGTSSANVLKINSGSTGSTNIVDVQNQSFVVQGDGNVGVGTGTPDQLLSVNGNASKVGGGLWTVFSDRRLKKDIHNFSDGLNIIEQMNTVVFKYNGKAGNPNDGKEYVGIIAQEVQEYAPYMIDPTHKKLNEDDSEDTELLMYDGSALLYILVNAVKEQQAIIEAQEALIGEQKDELETVKASSEERIGSLEEKVNWLLGAQEIGEAK